MSWLERWTERWGETGTLAMGALLIGLVFGFMAQRSRFCLRSAVIEFTRNQTGGRLTVWLFAFATAVGATQLLAWAGWFDAGNARQIAVRGSLSGAAIGGALFGVGMVLARGCSSRLLVLAAQGNLRSVVSGLIFAVTAQASSTGALSPLRLAISVGWTSRPASSTTSRCPARPWSHRCPTPPAEPADEFPPCTDGVAVRAPAVRCFVPRPHQCLQQPHADGTREPSTPEDRRASAHILFGPWNKTTRGCVHPFAS